MPGGENWARRVGANASVGSRSGPARKAAPAARAPVRKGGGLRAFLARGRAQAKKKGAEPDTESKWKVEGKAGVELDRRGYGFKRGNDKEFLNDKKTETSVELGAEKTWKRGEKRWLYYGNEHANLTVGKASGSFSSGLEYDFKEGTGSVSLIKLEGTAALLEAKAEGTALGGLLEGEAKVEVLAASGTVDLLSFSRDKKGKVEATLADVGVEANLVKGEIGGEVALTPRTIYDNLIGPVVGLFSAKHAKLSKHAKWADHGVVVGGTAEAGIGAAAKASAKYADGKFQLAAKAGAGPMAGFSLSFGIK